jgi:hypothetical protein
MTITLPDEMRDELERKAKAAGFATVAEYLLSLVPRANGEGAATEDAAGPPELCPKNRAELEAMLDAGMVSGPPIRMTPEFWEDMRRCARERLAAKSTLPIGG